MVIIPLKQIPAQRLQVVLDGQNCTIALYWRWGRVYCDLSVDATKISSSIVCLAMQPLPPFSTLDFKGQLCFIDTLGNEHPQWQGLGERWQLMYLSEGETLDSVIAGAAENA